MLSTAQEGLEEAQKLSLQMCAHSFGHHQPERISLVAVREQWGDVETIEFKLMRCRLEWLGHLARMQNHRLPKLCLFGWLPQTWPCGGPRRRWRDLTKKDLKAMEIGEDWYNVAQDRGK